ncbi:hypothetical protein KPL70_002547 [Citrus sinensis]|nr:hypothetical protein KPL70_002547 [Citrus sinensis]
MIPAASIFRLVALAWVVIFATAFAFSPIQLETKALLDTGWWNSSFWMANYSSDHCKWIGITCNSAGSIIGLNLSWYDVDLNAQAQLSQLNFSCFPNLESLRIQAYYYGFTGSIPSDISALSKLQLLDLSLNRLSGTIPSNIGNLRNLVHLDLEVTSMKNLTWLDISNNKIEGSIPGELTELSRPDCLSLSANKLSGPVPFSNKQLSTMYIVRLSPNKGLGSNFSALPSCDTTKPVTLFVEIFLPLSYSLGMLTSRQTIVYEDLIEATEGFDYLIQFPKFESFALSFLFRSSTALLSMTAVVSAQDVDLAPLPSMDAGAAFPVTVSGGFVCSSLFFSVITLLLQ